MTDYIACGKVVPERIADDRRRRRRGLPPGGLRPGRRRDRRAPRRHGRRTSTTWRAPAPGVVEADAMLGPDRVRAGDVVLGAGLLRRCTPTATRWSGTCVERAGLSLDASSPSWAGPSARSCSSPPGSTPWTAWRWPAPSRCTRTPTSPAAGWRRNLARLLPADLDALLDRASWTPPPIFEVLGAARQVAQEDMDRTFNMGVGMAAIVAADAAEPAGLLAERSCRPGCSARSSPAAARRVR